MTRVRIVQLVRSEQCLGCEPCTLQRLHLSFSRFLAVSVLGLAIAGEQNQREHKQQHPEKHRVLLDSQAAHQICLPAQNENVQDSTTLQSIGRISLCLGPGGGQTPQSQFAGVFVRDTFGT